MFFEVHFISLRKQTKGVISNYRPVIFYIVGAYNRSRYNHNKHCRMQQSFLKIWLLFFLLFAVLLTQLEIKNFNKGSSNEVVTFIFISILLSDCCLVQTKSQPALK